MNLFDDSFSYVHPVLGYASKSAPIIGIVFVLWHLFEKEPMSNKLGDLVEFGIGLMAANLVQK